ncbi:hypothetical protein Tco_0813118 [Tanacetum coccineum]
MSSEVESDTNTLILTTVVDIQALLGDSEEELKDDSDEELLEAGEEMDEEFLQSATNKDQPELSKAKKTDASNSESSSCSKTFKPYDNYMSITERQLYEEVAASYADLKWSINDFHASTIRQYENTDVVLMNYRHIITLFKTDHNTGIQRILDNLQEVHNAVKDDPALKKKVLEAVEAYIKNSTNLTELLTLVKNFDFPGLNTTIDSLQVQILGESSAHTTTISPIEETPSHTEGEKADMETAKKEPKVTNVKKEPEHETRDIGPIPIIVFRPTTKPTLEAKTEIIRSSSRPRLIEPIVEVQILELETLLLTPKPDKGKGIARDTKESPPKLIQAHIDKEENLEKAVREARVSKPELIKVVHEVAKEARVDPKAL